METFETEALFASFYAWTQQIQHFVSFCFINKRTNILFKRFYYSFDQKSETFERFHFVSIMKNVGTEALFALFYAWTKKINTSFHLVLLINEKISSVNVSILLSIRTPDFWTFSFRFEIESVRYRSFIIEEHLWSLTSLVLLSLWLGGFIHRLHLPPFPALLLCQFFRMFTDLFIYKYWLSIFCK